MPASCKAETRALITAFAAIESESLPAAAKRSGHTPVMQKYHTRTLACHRR
jgi:hypothetical protein